MEEKQICCCGASVWTRVIGWLQFAGSIMACIVLSSILANASAFLATADDGRGPDGERLTPKEIIAWKNLLAARIVFSVLKLILVLPTMIMALVLLRGSKNKNARLIHYWIVFTVINLIIWLVIAIAQVCVQPSGVVIVSTIIGWVFELAIQGFCLWVVRTHKKEIEASAGSASPGKA